MSKNQFSQLLSIAVEYPAIAVQTHDYPDPDAAAAAFSLAELLKQHDIEARATWYGMARSRSLANLAQETSIKLYPEPPKPPEALIFVDCAPRNGNVSMGDATLIGVIDHHVPAYEVIAPFVDLRTDAGSSCSIIAQYWKQAALSPPKEFATAMLAGVQSDTDFLSRGVGPLEIEAFAFLAPLADIAAATRMLKTNMDHSELVAITYALASANVYGDRILAQVMRNCSQEALSIAADLALRAREIKISVVYCEDGEQYRLSVRSRNPDMPAFYLIRELTQGIGMGGGHARSAGGIIYAKDFPGEASLLARLSAIR